MSLWSCQSPEGTESLNGPEQPPWGLQPQHPTPPGAQDTHSSWARSLLPVPCAVGLPVHPCLACGCPAMDPTDPASAHGPISWPDLSPASCLWPARQSRACGWPWVPAPGPILVAGLCSCLNLSPPYPRIFPGHLEMLLRLLLALPGWLCLGTVGLGSCIIALGSPQELLLLLLLARQLLLLHAELIPGSPGSLKGTF